MTSRKKKITFFSVYFTFFVDTLSWAIVFPIFAPYFLDPNNGLFSADVTKGTRTMILGFFLMAFSLGQFLGAPLIGEYADKHGRKKALAVGVFFTLIGLCISAWSMQVNNLTLLFIGRLVTGVFASSTTVCLTCISDLSEGDGSKVKNFGYLSMSAGFAFIIGAFVGGKLSDKSISSYFTANFPIWIAAGITVVNFLFILFGFKETVRLHPTVQFDFFAAFRNVKMALRTEKIKRVYCIYFLFLFAWTILLQFMPVLTVERFAFTNSNLGDLALFVGICWAIGSGYLNDLLASYFKPKHILEMCLIGFTIFCGLIVFPERIWTLFALLGFCVMLGGLAWPICTSFISNMAPKDMQGKVMGVSQSVQSFAMTLAPLIGGMAFHISFAAPFLIAAGTSLIAVVIYFLMLKDL